MPLAVLIFAPRAGSLAQPSEIRWQVPLALVAVQSAGGLRKAARHGLRRFAPPSTPPATAEIDDRTDTCLR
jgi:hypothetical protein